jgi:hypothetical protein
LTVDTLGRALGLYRRTAVTRSAIALLIANVIPLIGVLFFGWSLMTILVVYWVENGIVGLWNLPRIALAQGSVIPQLPDMPASAALAATGNLKAAESLQTRWRQAQEARARQEAAGGLAAGRLPGAGRVGLSIFFLIHYGFFWLGHGLFLFLFLPGIAGMTSGGVPALDPFCEGSRSLPPGLPPELISGGVVDAAGCNGSFGEILWGSVAIAAIALVISHGASFLFNYIGRGEYLTASPMRQMGAPYARVVVLHLTIILGGIVVAFLGSPIGALFVLVGLKTAFDLGLHLRERRAADARIPADTTYGKVVREA